MRRAALALAVVLVTWQCAKAPPPVAPFPNLNYDCFVAKVEPELQRSCSFSKCHGADERPLKLYSLAGVRGPYGPDDFFLSELEHRANFNRALVYAAATSSVLPDILRKPLQLEQGGAGHGGVDRFQRNVYASKEDTGWKTLNDWVTGAAGCEVMGTGGGAGGGDATGGGAGGGTGGGGTVGPTCAARIVPGADWETISTYINPMRCADADGCHQPENFVDAGCFNPASCETVRTGGCMKPSVVPCRPFGSKLWLYAGVLKNHNNKFSSIPGLDITQVIGDWIDAGATCDGGDFP